MADEPPAEPPPEPEPEPQPEPEPELRDFSNDGNNPSLIETDTFIEIENFIGADSTIPLYTGNSSNFDFQDFASFNMPILKQVSTLTLTKFECSNSSASITFAIAQSNSFDTNNLLFSGTLNASKVGNDLLDEYYNGTLPLKGNEQGETYTFFFSPNMYAEIRYGLKGIFEKQPQPEPEPESEPEPEPEPEPQPEPEPEPEPQPEPEPEPEPQPEPERAPEPEPEPEPELYVECLDKDNNVNTYEDENGLKKYIFNGRTSPSIDPLLADDLAFSVGRGTYYFNVDQENAFNVVIPSIPETTEKSFIIDNLTRGTTYKVTYIVGSDVQITSDTLLLTCLLYTSPSPRDISGSRMPSSA